MRSIIGWVALAIGVAAVLGIAREPTFWYRYLIGMAHSGGELPLSFYEPRELVPGGNQPPPPREPPASESLDVKALEAAADYAGSHHSRALIVSRHGYLVFERYWRGSNFDTQVDSGALGRVVAALVTGSAISGRSIGWPDAPIGMFLTEWRADPRGAITVRNLLQLSSGLVPPAASVSPWSTAADELYGTHIVRDYLQQPLRGAPGGKWVEQSADADLLAQVLERAAHQRYAQYVSQALWRRIGAADAWVWLDRPGGAAHVDRGFLVHQGDWLRVAELFLQNGRYQGAEVLVPRWVPQLLQPAKSNSDYGAYLRLAAHAAAAATAYDAGDLLLVQGGGNRLWMIPSLQIAILRTGDPPRGAPAGGAASGGTAADTAADWDDARIPNLILHGARDYSPVGARPGDLSSIVPHH